MIFSPDRDNHVIVSSRDESRGAQISEPDLDSGLWQALSGSFGQHWATSLFFLCEPGCIEYCHVIKIVLNSNIDM